MSFPGSRLSLAAMHAFAADAFVRAARLRGDEHVLEVGCAEGHTTAALHRALVGDGCDERKRDERGRIVALDARAPARATTARRAHLKGPGRDIEVSVRAYDRITLPLDVRERASFDVVVVRHELQLAPDPTALLDECLGALRPGGRLLLVDDDFSTLRLTPPLEGFDEVWRHYTEQVLAVGRDPHLGRRLPELIDRTAARTTQIAPLVYGGKAGEHRFDLAADAIHESLSITRARAGSAAHAWIDVLDAWSAWRTDPNAALWYSAWLVEAKRRVAGFFAMTP